MIICPWCNNKKSTVSKTEHWKGDFNGQIKVVTKRIRKCQSCKKCFDTIEQQVNIGLRELGYIKSTEEFE